MSSSSAPSTATSSSLSRADSLTTMEYLQGAHPLSHGYPHRHFSSAGGSGSTTTGSSTGSSFGHQSAAGSSVSGSSNGGPRSLRHHSHHHHHSSALALGRANLNAAIHHHQQRPLQEMVTPRSSVADTVGSGKHGSSTTGTTEQQARNSTKRAAQNRAAQRAFRQRKDLYVRDLERKAEMLQQAEGKIMALTARNRELEVALAASQSSTSSSPQQSPLHLQPSPNMAAGVSATAPAPPGTSSSSSTALDREQDREPLVRERERFLLSRDQESPHENTPPSTRPTLGRHASAHQLHYTYTSSALSSSPPQSNGSIKYPTTNPSLPQQALRRSESDFEFECHEYNAHPHRHLHRHPSEPSLKYRQRESNSADSGDDYVTARGGSMHGARSGSIDSGMQTSQYPQSSSSSNTHPFKQHQASPSSELPPLHPIATSAGKPTTLGTSSGYSSSPSARSWSHPQDGSAASNSPMSSSTSHAASSARGGMVAAAPSPSRSHGTIPLQNAEMEYVSDDRSESGSGCGMVQKRPSDGAISWSGSSQYFSSLHVQHQQIAQGQQQQRSPVPHPLHPQTPEHEYSPPGIFTGSPQSQQGRQQLYRDKYTRDQHHHLQHHVNTSTGSEMDAVYDQSRHSSSGYHDEASMGSP
ncbi:hypothetical protein BG011_006469 [Mortierella polycephala]|uniref:BZIP domain-containing protein n=1 Tax=Mortierella polycephala TaxID=41804 RepID=A0A9P6QFX5_9FUNG|nr:hypothetical protein BG011_006469 [Mortierella polycephala]